MLLAADHVPPAPDGLDVDELEVGVMVGGLDEAPLPLLEQAVATVPASMQAITAVGKRHLVAHRGPRTLLVTLVPPGVAFGNLFGWPDRRPGLGVAHMASLPDLAPASSGETPPVTIGDTATASHHRT